MAGIPVLIGALVSKTQISWNIFHAIFAAMLGVGFANSFNSIVDRRIDRLNPSKKNLAITKPLAAWYGVLFLLPILAICLRSNTYNHCFFAILYYLSFSYSYLFGRIPIVKRVAVAAIIASTAFLYVQTFSLALWLFVGFSFVLFLVREGHKDKVDEKEDKMMRFAWKDLNRFDWWCISAPFLAVGIYIGCLCLTRYPVSLVEAVISFGIGVSVWSYIQIRYRYRQYHMRLIHQTTGGRLGAVIALVGLMPSFVNPAFILVVLANSGSIVYRSFLNRKIASCRAAIIHDSYLWASLPLLAITKAGFRPALVVASVILGCFVYLYENKRLHCQPMASY
jgi:4-hydroxybenzoate polyprenyltransferase